MTEAEIWELIKDQRWYVVLNDIVSVGWAIANTNKPLSRLLFREGELGVADFMIREAADHIVELHNAALIGEADGT